MASDPFTERIPRYCRAAAEYVLPKVRGPHFLDLQDVVEAAHRLSVQPDKDWACSQVLPTQHRNILPILLADSPRWQQDRRTGEGLPPSPLRWDSGSTLIRYPFEQVGDADIDARLRQQGAGLSTMMSLMVEEVQ